MCTIDGGGVQGEVSMWRAMGAAAGLVQSSKGSKSKGRAPAVACSQPRVCSAGLRALDGPASGGLLAGSTAQVLR